MHPTHNGGVGHRQAALGHHLHQIPEAELEAQVPPHAQDDDLAIKVPTIKQLVHARKPGHRTALNSPVGCEATTAGNLHQSPFGDQAAVKQSVRFRASTLPVGHLA
ncbi:MAG TPA: hypothetical protein VK822_06835 [Acetobacteraceae bacterium]|nr:hypothetical protein [Acetobacteraceae bacterium]